MTAEDRRRWDERHAAVTPGGVGLPDVFAPHAELFPTAGRALELACGQGAAAAWLAERGLDVLALDVSEVALAAARSHPRCTYLRHDLDDGLPPGPPVEVLLCHRFRDPRLYRAMVERLAPGGLLAVAVLSEVGATAGAFRAAPGELLEAFGRDLDVFAAGEADGEAWVLARSPGGSPSG